MGCKSHLRLCLIATLMALATSIKHLKIIKTEEVKEEDCKQRTKKGDKITLHYSGTLKDGTVFESSYEEGREPAVFHLGREEVIEGWEQGLLDMCEGEKRRLSVPPSMGYGETGQKHTQGSGQGKIPQGATIYFDVHLLKIEEGLPPLDVFKNIDVNGDNLLSQDEVKAFLKEHIAQEYPDQAELYSGDWGLDKATAYVYRDVDSNQDGLITYEEFAERHVKGNRDRHRRDEL